MVNTILCIIIALMTASICVIFTYSQILRINDRRSSEKMQNALNFVTKMSESVSGLIGEVTKSLDSHDKTADNTYMDYMNWIKKHEKTE